MKMQMPLRVLIIEDSEDDTILLVQALRRGGYVPVFEQVDTPAAMTAALNGQPWDIVISDYSMPNFSGLAALQLLKESGLDIPFIILSGAIGEETAVEVMRAGAHDCIMKNNRARLVPAIEQELREAEVRRQRKKVVESLRESEEKYRELFENANDLIQCVDVNGNFAYVNKKWLETLGYSKDELRELKLTDILRKDQIPHCMELFKRIVSGESLEKVETVFMTKDDCEILVEGNVNAQIRDGKFIATRGIFRDITERKRTEEELRKEHTRKEQLLTAISSILIGVDKNDQITMWNATAERIFGITKTHAVGHPFRECGIQWAWDKVIDGILACRKTKQPTRVDDIPFTLPDGTEGLLGITLSPINGKDSEHSGFLLLGADITKRKILEEQLRQARKLESIGQLAAGIAHEINTPIQYVGDNTRFIQESFTDIFNLLEKYHSLLEASMSGTIPAELIEEVEDALDDADMEFLSEEIPLAIQQSLEGIDQVANIVQAMKEFSHPGVEGKTAIDINKAIENTITVTRNEWKYVAEMETSFDTALPLIPCLQGEFNQVILNILLNAAHAIADIVEDGSEKKGEITVSTHRDGDWAEIRISDTGTGIPEEVKTKIFDPFFTTKDVGKGTGQGLAISHNVVVEKHGGTLNFSTEMGKGTTFIIRLPIKDRI